MTTTFGNLYNRPDKETKEIKFARNYNTKLKLSRDLVLIGGANSRGAVQYLWCGKILSMEVMFLSNA